jgi:hypothetical protein
MVTVEREGSFLNYRRDGHIFYDPAIPSEAALAQFMSHMREKRWFAEVEADTLRILADYHQA